jgi:hypothetical protein
VTKAKARTRKEEAVKALLLVLLLCLAAVLSSVAPVSAATGAVPSLWKNCTNVHKRYPHGVGKLRARDGTTGTPVTTFKRSTRLYNIAIKYHKDLDRDRDGIACEKR